jgi:predicted kinase
MKTVVMSIGIPGSGKTTALLGIAQARGIKIVSPDAVREERGIDPSDRARNPEVWKEVRLRVRTLLEQEDAAIVDATFTSRSARQEFIRYLRTIGVDEIAGLYLDTPLALAKERNIARDRKVSEKVLERRHAALQAQPPTLAEGFDHLFTLAELPALSALLA